MSKIISDVRVHLWGAPLFMQVLQNDDVILHDWGQACHGIPKEAIKTSRSQKLKQL